ncbi:hypothetical protein D3C84_921880 [compost metagenome]
MVFQVGRDPDAPLWRGKEATRCGVYAENTADGVGKLHPVMTMGLRPGTGAQALDTGVQRPRQLRQVGDAAFELLVSVRRH